MHGEANGRSAGFEPITESNPQLVEENAKIIRIARKRQAELMVAEPSQLQKQTQRLIMTPQMQQSIQRCSSTPLNWNKWPQQELMEIPF